MRMPALAALVLVVCACGSAAAQPRRTPQPLPVRVHWTGATLDLIERALYERERLDLSDEQVNRLDALRREQVERGVHDDADRRDLLSRARAGLIDGDELRDGLEAIDDQVREAAEREDEVEAILTEDQLDRLEETRGPWRRLPAAVVPYGWTPRPAPVAPPRWGGPDTWYWHWDQGSWRRDDGRLRRRVPAPGFYRPYLESPPIPPEPGTVPEPPSSVPSDPPAPPAAPEPPAQPRRRR